MEQRHSAITDEELEALEGSIGDLLLKLGLQTPEPASPMPSPPPRRTPKHYHYP